MDQQEFAIGSRAGYWLIRIVQTVFVFIAVTILITLVSGPGPDHVGTFFLATWSIGVLLMVVFGHRNLATAAIKESGLEVRQLFRSKIIPWSDVVSVRYSFWRSGPMVLIAVKPDGSWSPKKVIRVPCQSEAWTGVKESFGFAVPQKVVRFMDEVAKHQASGSNSISYSQ